MNLILYLISTFFIGLETGKHFNFLYSTYIFASLSVLIAIILVNKIEIKRTENLLLFTFAVMLIFLDSSFHFIIYYIIFITLLYSYSRQKKFSRYLERVITDNQKEASEFNKILQSLKKERHDYLKHISAIQYLVDTKNIDEAQKYLNSIINKFENTNLFIRGEQGVIAAILNDRFQRAQNSHIELNYNLAIPLSQLSIKNEHLVSLIGNILDNALDAAEDYKKKTNNTAHIDLVFTKKSGIFILECKNSTCPIPSEIADNLFKKGEITTKTNHDGLGTVIISDIVKHNNGHLNYIYYKDNFTLKIKFPAVQLTLPM